MSFGPQIRPSSTAVKQHGAGSGNLEHTPALQSCTNYKDFEGLEEVHQSCRPSNGQLGVTQSEVNYSHITECVCEGESERERETGEVGAPGSPTMLDTHLINHSPGLGKGASKTEIREVMFGQIQTLAATTPVPSGEARTSQPDPQGDGPTFTGHSDHLQAAMLRAE